MVQQGQVFQLTRCGPGAERLWAYRYRTGGRESERVQRGGFASSRRRVTPLSASLSGVGGSGGPPTHSRLLSS